MPDIVTFDRFMELLDNKDYIQSVATGRWHGKPYVEMVGYQVPSLLVTRVNTDQLRVKRIRTINLSNDYEITADTCRVRNGDPCMVHAEFYISRDFRGYDAQAGVIEDWDRCIIDEDGNHVTY